MVGALRSMCGPCIGLGHWLVTAGLQRGNAELKELLIVAHCPSDNMRRLAAAALQGAQDPRIEGLSVRLAAPMAVDAEAVQKCAGMVLGTTENFGYMAGALKDFFERVYYPCLQTSRGLPYALWVRAGEDGRGAQASVERIIQGLGWRAIQAPLILRGAWRDEFAAQVQEQSLTVAAALAADLY